MNRGRGSGPLRYYLSCWSSLSIIMFYKQYHGNNIYEKNTKFTVLSRACLAVLNLNDKKTQIYKTLVGSATCVLNREYVITNCAYIIENSIMKSQLLPEFKNSSAALEPRPPPGWEQKETKKVLLDGDPSPLYHEPHYAISEV